MSNYTEADVEQARVRVRALIRGQVVSLNEQASLETLIVAALEGAKVPGLVADNAALFAHIGAMEEALEACQSHIRQAATDYDVPFPASLMDEPPTLEAAHSVALKQRDAIQAKVSAIQARVAELTRERDELLESSREEASRSAVDLTLVREERDALRAQVEAMRAASAPLVDWCRRSLEARGIPSGPMVKAGEARAFVIALSAPPAETTPTSGDSPVLYVLELYRGEGEWDPMFLGTIASTVREKVDVKDRSMGSTRIAEYVRRTPAETTPAPERAECKP